MVLQYGFTYKYLKHGGDIVIVKTGLVHQYDLLHRRTDLDEDVVMSIHYTEEFCNNAETKFIQDGMDFYDACNSSLMLLSDSLNSIGKKLNFNGLIPIIYKFWLYAEEFQNWLQDSDDDEFLLVNI